jgi:hypothetical protein
MQTDGPVNDRGSTCVVLVDNGSIRDHALLFTRKLARDLERRSGLRVIAASLAHSDRIPPEKLNGEPAWLLGSLLDTLAEQDTGAVVVLPLLMTRWGAIYNKVADVAKEAVSRHPGMQVVVGGGLVEPPDAGPRSIPWQLASAMQRSMDEAGVSHAEWIVVDHGSPVPEVAQVRDWVARQVAAMLPEGRAARVVAASMERREGPEYAFADPLLDVALRAAVERGVQEVWVAKLFLQPGRHSGRAGDVEQIVARVCKDHPQLKVHMPRQVFHQKHLTHVLHDRLQQAVGALAVVIR